TYAFVKEPIHDHRLGIRRHPKKAARPESRRVPPRPCKIGARTHARAGMPGLIPCYSCTALGHLDFERVAGDGQLVAVSQGRALDHPPVDSNSVDTAEVFHHDSVQLDEDLAVPLGNIAGAQNNVARRSPANDSPGLEKP